jgi:hypothetical protein
VEQVATGGIWFDFSFKWALKIGGVKSLQANGSMVLSMSTSLAGLAILTPNLVSLEVFFLHFVYLRQIVWASGPV